MKKEVFYRQCRLRKSADIGYTEQVSWIPEPFCKIGKTLKLKEGEVWVDGWLVIDASEDKIGEQEANARSRSYLKHRKNTDI